MKKRLRFLFVLLFGFVILTVQYGCRKKQDNLKTVTVYVSEDQIFSEPILKDFEKETGIKVRAVYDT